MTILQRMHVKGSRFRHIKTIINGDMNINLNRLHKTPNNIDQKNFGMLKKKAFGDLDNKRISDFETRPKDRKDKRQKLGWYNNLS